jgi:hypothetical protein
MSSSPEYALVRSLKEHGHITLAELCRNWNFVNLDDLAKEFQEVIWPHPSRDPHDWDPKVIELLTCLSRTEYGVEEIQDLLQLLMNDRQVAVTRSARMTSDDLQRLCDVLIDEVEPTRKDEEDEPISMAYIRIKEHFRVPVRQLVLASITHFACQSWLTEVIPGLHTLKPYYVNADDLSADMLELVVARKSLEGTDEANLLPQDLQALLKVQEKDFQHREAIPKAGAVGVQEEDGQDQTSRPHTPNGHVAKPACEVEGSQRPKASQDSGNGLPSRRDSILRYKYPPLHNYCEIACTTNLIASPRLV